ncbi:hypothetical protein M5K25_022268 [Dendrobium thyrsiflorum]|uniref:Alpha/beta hydrolase fold-3 domain-containing protein n=1 Tax=Dendrobium thyrsiflorum TaxID=117978 RepID=A0ABD0UBZ2_DENTH
MGDHGIECSAKPNSANLFLQIIENPDGTITRPFVPQIPPSDLIDGAAVRSRDIPLNPSSKTSLRLYLPSSSLQKLPIILFFHGGGFILFNSSSAPYHFFCEQMAQSLSALVLSLDYRLAPDHRLPAAYDDALDAILWLRDQAAADSSERDPWLASHADFDRFFIAGSSSGANMAFHAAIRIADLDLQPLKIAGILLNQPYLGGEERTKSEDDSENDVILPLRASDMMWRLALPLGADRDHEYSNPAAAMSVSKISQIRARCLIKGRKGDPLIDRQRQFVKVMEAAGVPVVGQLEEEGIHAIEIFDPAAAEAFFFAVKEFINA